MVKLGREQGNCNLGAGSTKTCTMEQEAAKNLEIERGAGENIREKEEKLKGSRKMKEK